MEILEIRSSHDLTSKLPAARRVSEHSYWLNCRQFVSVHREWQRNRVPERPGLGLMTLGFERIWITEEEIGQVATAIKMTTSPVALG